MPPVGFKPTISAGVSENDSIQIYYLFFINDKINNSITTIKAAEETCNFSCHKRPVVLF
jgi:hypothetical protein